MGKGFSSSDLILGSDDSVNGYPYADAFGNPDDIIAPDWLTSTFSTDSDLQSGFATAIVLGDGFDPKLHLYDATGFTYYKINDPVADDDAFDGASGGLNSQTSFYAFPGATYQAVVESVGSIPPAESRNFYFEVQIDDAGNDLLNAKDLGDLSNNIYAFADDFVGVSDADDYYKFDLSTAETVELNIGGLLGDVDVELLDSSGFLIDFSTNSGTDAEQITATLNPGTYYIHTEAFNAFDTARAIVSNDVASNYFLDLAISDGVQPNQNPNDIILLNGIQTVDSIDENKPAGTVVGNFSTSDPDDPNKVDSYTYSLVSGAGSADNSKFTVSSTGVLTVNQPFDYEAAQKSYAIRVQTQDKDGGTYTKAFTIGVRDIKTGDANDSGIVVQTPKPPQTAKNKPTDLGLSSLSILENQPSGTTVGTLSTTDPDAGDTFTYSLVSGVGSTDNAAFEIVGNTLKTKQTFDFETKNAYSIRVRTTDSAGLTFEKEVKLAVGDIAEARIPSRPNLTGKPIIGTSKNDRLPGTANDDLIRGLRGDDKLNGRGGNDVLVGGADDDTLKGGVGDDILRGSAGEDIYFLQNNGIDTIQAFSVGEDTLKLTDGLTFSNLVITQQGNNTLIGAGNNQFALLAGVNASQITVADFV